MNLILILIFFFLTLSVLFFSYSYFKNKTGNVLYLVIYLVCMLLTNAMSYISSELNLNNLFISHIYFWIQFIIISLLFRSLITSRIPKIIIHFFLITVPLVLMVQYIWKPEIFLKLNLLEIILCSLPLCSFSVMYLFQSLESKSKKWLFFSTGIFIYLLCSTIVFVAIDTFYQKFSKMPFWGRNFWIINNIVYLLYLILILVEWFVNLRRPRQFSVREN